VIQVETNHKGRLLEEILTGKLCLRADSLVRYRFAFSVDEMPIGVYRIASIKPKEIALLRAWNRTSSFKDPFTGLFVTLQGRQFHHIQPGKLCFLVEFGEEFTRVVDRIAFKAGRAVLRDVVMPGASEELRFESIELAEIEIVG